MRPATMTCNNHNINNTLIKRPLDQSLAGLEELIPQLECIMLKKRLHGIPTFFF